MDRVAAAAELTNFFAVAISVIFGVWFERIESVLALKRPLAYAERAPYVRQIVATITGRALPMWLVITSFIAAFASTTISVLHEHSLAFGSEIDAPATVYCLLYWFLLYVLLVTTYQLWALGKKLQQSREGRPAQTPRVKQL